MSVIKLSSEDYEKCFVLAHEEAIRVAKRMSSNPYLYKTEDLTEVRPVIYAQKIAERFAELKQEVLYASSTAELLRG